MIENRTFAQIELGDTASITRVLTEKDIQLFAIVSGDVNPAHVDAAYARQTRFHELIAHGMWGGALISAVLGTKLPGPGTIYLSQSLDFRAPVRVGDRIISTVKVVEKHSHKPIVTLQCTCVNQSGHEVISGQAVVMAPVEKMQLEQAILPEVDLHPAKDAFCQRLVSMCAGLPPLKTAIVHPVDGNSLGGAVAAAHAGLMLPVLVGPEAKIRATAEEAGLDISGFELVATEHSHAAAEAAVALARSGQVDALMKGKLHTDELMQAVLDKQLGLRTGRRMSHVFALQVPAYPKPLFLTDAALNIRPDLSAKRDIVQNAIDLFIALEFGTPRVALLSAVETVNEAIPSTLDATALCKMADRGQITGGLLDGPLAFDNAISPEAASAKGIVSQVAGQADILVVPDVESGNMLYKQLRYLFGVEAAGVVLGSRVPIILTSRAAGPGLTRLASSALALLYARKQPKKA